MTDAGKIPWSFGRLTNLSELFIDENNLTGKSLRPLLYPLLADCSLVRSVFDTTMTE